MNRECYLCKSKEKDEIRYGEFMTRGKISVHYFCLLLSSNLMQNGKDSEGFLGFLAKDIQKEESRVRALICCYCQKYNANISCCASRCYKSFHLTCGEKNNTEHHFVGTFQSFCNRHVKGKKITPPVRDEKCCICYDNLYETTERFNTVKMIRAPCCKNGWFHKYCLAAFAKSAGYFFKCPLCNDSKVFRQRLPYKNIFIPDRDAAWELEPNAFAELLERPNTCSAIDCRIQEGQNSQNDFLFCETCGSVAIHRMCMTIQVEAFVCDECLLLTGKIKTAPIVNITAYKQHSLNLGEDEDEEEEIDVGDDDFDFEKLHLVGTSDELQKIKPDETIKPSGIKRKIESTDDNSLRSELNIKKTISSSNNNFDDDNEEIYPLGRINFYKYKIIDSDTSESDFDDNKNYAILESRNNVKRINHILSDELPEIKSSITITTSNQEKHLTSCDSQSLFDSGAESDRSGNSIFKPNSKRSLNSSKLESPMNDFSEKSEKRVIQKRNIKTPDFSKDTKNKFSNVVIYNETNIFQTTKNITKEGQKISNTFEKELLITKKDKNKKKCLKDIPKRILMLEKETFSNSLSSYSSNEKNKMLNIWPASSTSSQLSDYTKLSPMRLRSRPEEISKKDIYKTRRKSCNSILCTNSLDNYRGTNKLKRSIDSLELISSKRSRLESISENNSNYKTSIAGQFHKDEDNIEIRKHKTETDSFTLSNISDAYHIPWSQNLKQINQEPSPNSKPKITIEEYYNNQNNFFEINGSKKQKIKTKQPLCQKSPKAISTATCHQPKIESYFKRI